MLLALYHILTNVVLPLLIAVTNGLLPTIMTCVIILAGIAIAMSAVGMPVNAGGVTFGVVSAITRALIYIGRSIIRGIGWIVRTVANFLPRVFRGTRRELTRAGMNRILANIIAVLVTIVVLAVII